jgi:hypothetical protein
MENNCDCNPDYHAICPNCGLHSNRQLYSVAASEKAKELHILPDLALFPYNDETKMEITQLYSKATGGKIKRNAPRRAIIYCCIVAISKQREIVFDADDLRTKLDLKEKDINKIMKEIEPVIKNHTSHANLQVTIEDVLKTIIKTFDLNEAILPEMVAIHGRCSRVSKLFISSRVETLAAGIAYYYLNSISSSFDQDRYFQQSKISRDTILAIAAEIQRIIE